MFEFKLRAKPEDRRRSQRHSVQGMAKILLGAGSLPRDCWVSDISDGGARLHAEDVTVPDQFLLMLPNVSRRQCRVVWRLGHEIGVEFVDRFAQGFARQAAGAR